jgi:hypothetical protein
MSDSSAIQAFLREKVSAYREVSFLCTSGSRISSLEQAVRFVNQRGYIFFWPCKGIIFPSLWVANAGDRPVPDEHDDPGHITWDWKDSTLGKNLWYYGRILHKRNAFISLETAPYFYALSENYGNFKEDYLLQYEQGEMALEAKQIYEAILIEGPLDTISLRKKAHLTGRQSDSPFNKALNYLMADFKLMPIGISDAGAWHYSHIYEIVARYMPDLVEKARYIQESLARKKIIQQYFASVGAARIEDIGKLFGWLPEKIEPILMLLEHENFIRSGFSLSTDKKNWYLINELVQ